MRWSWNFMDGIIGVLVESQVPEKVESPQAEILERKWEKSAVKKQNWVHSAQGRFYLRLYTIDVYSFGRCYDTPTGLFSLRFKKRLEKVYKASSNISLALSLVMVSTKSWPQAENTRDYQFFEISCATCVCAPMWLQNRFYINKFRWLRERSRDVLAR